LIDKNRIRWLLEYEDIIRYILIDDQLDTLFDFKVRCYAKIYIYIQTYNTYRVGWGGVWEVYSMAKVYWVLQQGEKRRLQSCIMKDRDNHKIENILLPAAAHELVKIKLGKILTMLFEIHN